MEKNGNGYLDTTKATEQLVRVELLFAPILIVLPLVVSLLMIWHWYFFGYLQGNGGAVRELLIAAVILFGNLLFDVPFLRSLLLFKKIKKRYWRESAK